MTGRIRRKRSNPYYWLADMAPIALGALHLSGPFLELICPGFESRVMAQLARWNLFGSSGRRPNTLGCLALVDAIGRRSCNRGRTGRTCGRGRLRKPREERPL